MPTGSDLIQIRIARYTLLFNFGAATLAAGLVFMGFAFNINSLESSALTNIEAQINAGTSARLTLVSIVLEKLNTSNSLQSNNTRDFINSIMNNGSNSINTLETEATNVTTTYNQFENNTLFYGELLLAIGLICIALSAWLMMYGLN